MLRKIIMNVNCARFFLNLKEILKIIASFTAEKNILIASHAKNTSKLFQLSKVINFLFTKTKKNLNAESVRKHSILKEIEIYMKKLTV
jgi:hypothetical protein